MDAVRVVTLVAVVGASCAIPRDPEGTLERVTGGSMRVGITANEPWTSLETGAPSGVEVDLVERFARDLEAEIEWIEGSTEELMTALEEHQLDLAIGGLVEDDPWSTKVAFTHFYATTRTVVALPPGASALDDLDGIEVAVEPGSEAAGLVEDAGGIPVPTSGLASAGLPVAAEDWRTDALGFESSGIMLSEEKQVMAVPLGENAWLVRLERFLLADGRRVADLLERELSS